jgi:phospholipid transport system substrate-binding protein
MFRALSFSRRVVAAATAIGVLLLGSGPAPALAATEDPVTVVRAIFDELLTELDAKRANESLTAASAREIFAELLNPRIDYASLARWILREYWTGSSSAQQAAFLDAFKAYIINTYALALSSGQSISLEVADEPLLRRNTAVVHAAFSVADAAPVPLEFRLIERNDEWLLFDVSFAGVSLALTFRSDFSYVARDGGIDAVTTHLVQRSGGS